MKDQKMLNLEIMKTAKRGPSDLCAKSKRDYLFLSLYFSSALKSVLRKTRSNVVNAPNISGGSNPKEANKVKPEAGYDFIEGSGKLTENK